MTGGVVLWSDDGGRRLDDHDFNLGEKAYRVLFNSNAIFLLLLNLEEPTKEYSTPSQLVHESLLSGLSWRRKPHGQESVVQNPKAKKRRKRNRTYQFYSKMYQGNVSGWHQEKRMIQFLALAYYLSALAVRDTGLDLHAKVSE